MLGTTGTRRARLAALVARRVGTLIDKGTIPELEITDVSSYPLCEPVSRRRYTILKLQSKSGVMGYGECQEIPSNHLIQAKRTIVGMAATAFEVVRHQLKSLPGVQAAVNIALLDMLGKFVHAPVYQLVGGPTRFKARVMTTVEGNTEAALLASFRRAEGGAFRAFAVPLPLAAARDRGESLVYATKRRLDALRTASGEHADFVLAGTGDLPAADALELAGWRRASAALRFEK